MCGSASAAVAATFSPDRRPLRCAIGGTPLPAGRPRCRDYILSHELVSVARCAGPSHDEPRCPPAARTSTGREPIGGQLLDSNGPIRATGEVVVVHQVGRHGLYQQIVVLAGRRPAGRRQLVERPPGCLWPARRRPGPKATEPLPRAGTSGPTCCRRCLRTRTGTDPASPTASTRTARALRPLHRTPYLGPTGRQGGETTGWTSIRPVSSKPSSSSCPTQPPVGAVVLDAVPHLEDLSRRRDHLAVEFVSHRSRHASPHGDVMPRSVYYS